MADTFPRQNARTQRFTLGAPRNFTVTSDGATVVFLRSQGPEDPVNRLWAFDVESGDERLVADPPRLLAETADVELPAAERARRERAREGAAGIVGYSADREGRHVAFALAGRLYCVAIGARSDAGGVVEVDTADGVFDPRMSPDGRHVTYVVGNELHVAPSNGSEPGRPLVSEAGEHVSWGSAEFIAAEEMRRSRGHWWSPDSARLVVARVDVSGVDEWFIADPAQPWSRPTAIRYPAAGTTNADVQLALVDLEGGHRAVEWTAEGREYLVDVQWKDDEPLTLITSSRSQRTMEVLVVDEAEGSSSVVATLEDPHWVEIVPGTPRWVGDDLLTVVEHDGARVIKLGGNVITPTEQWVREIVSAGEDGVIYTASSEPTQADLWAIDHPDEAEAAAPRLLREAVGAAVGDATAMVQVETSLYSPPMASVVVGERRSAVTTLAATPLVTPQVDMFEAGRRGIRTAVLLPTTETPEPLPVLLDPYGGPHAQRVVRNRNAFLASQWLADQGYCVVVADGRGTPGRGGGWEQAVRGDLAGPVLEDQVAALDSVLERYGPRVDPNRVAVRGWSFGGYLAALAVLRRPDRFHAAIAGAPVTDWRWYDTHYTERYLGDPALEPESYDRSSLVDEAGSLTRPLLVIHGLADDNVVAAHTLQLSSALLAAGRPHEVLPLSGVTHMTPQEEVAENLLLLQVDFLRRSLGQEPSE